MKSNSQAIKKIEELSLPEASLAEIIPFPQIKLKKRKVSRKARIMGHYLFYKGKRIPIGQFQKAGYDRLLKLLVKEIG
ncbi:MAG: hypothetical protein N3B16_00010 [Candidatus Aminicenantes bacterium]|nr:hypothetical protein [Candidatus Aminicenantes bacterium]